jgi:hypothetical protein
MKPPKKPFPGYKWRWATLLPTEGLNDPSVFLGVLRVLRRFEGRSPASPAILSALKVVQSETGTSVNLARTANRNIIRNSGQYWKALGLYSDRRGEVVLTDFGREVADAKITKAEFATVTIKTLELPNTYIQQDAHIWRTHGIKIKPLELIIQILNGLSEQLGNAQAFITPHELVKIVIPLAGAMASLPEHLKAIKLFRDGRLDLSGWPDCAPEANDSRMAREFLLFLYEYGICDRHPGPERMEEKYYLFDIGHDEIIGLTNLNLTGVMPQNVVQVVRTTDFPAVVERKRILTEVLERPLQARFRKIILDAFNATCLITGVELEEVLEAAHILPVSKSGPDTIDNGLCLRSDIHLLFDAGHLRINSSGEIVLSETASHDLNYGHLPRQIVIPPFIGKERLDWRWKYW